MISSKVVDEAQVSPLAAKIPYSKKAWSMMLKFGYTLGSGLSKKEQGMSTPIETRFKKGK